MLSVLDLLHDYRAGRRDPSDVIAESLRHRPPGPDPAWITRVDDDTLLERARLLDHGDRSLPLYGVPFAVKDNIDVAGLPTTAGCPGFAHRPERTAPAIVRLLAAGALLIGKTNLDQFATGLVGTRTPYGVCTSVFDERRIAGGSSSGSAVAVARGEVAFAIGTDTAGSGRVPAAFNELVGLKPTRGLLSTLGVVPACASLDCVSVFAAGVADAELVLEVTAAYESEDPWSRRFAAPAVPRLGRLAVPAPGQVSLEEPAAQAAWERSLAHAAERWPLVEVDVQPLLEAAPLLYAIWVAERTSDLGEIVAARPSGLDPIVAAIVGSGRGTSGVDVFAAEHRLRELRRDARALWPQADALLMPTTRLHPTVEQVAADPIGINARLGEYTNFANLMDLSAIAIPGARREDGLPFGVTLFAPAFHDHRLLDLAGTWRQERVRASEPGAVRLAVVGAHLSGLPLNPQLTQRGARLLRAAVTAPAYRLYALPGSGVARPGLVRVPRDGAAIAVEVWELSPAALGSLLAGVPSPLAIGRVTLADGEEVSGFLCEEAGAAQALDITAHGGWRQYLAATEPLAGATAN